MKEILLTHGQHTLVDDQDYEWLNQWKWYALWNPGAHSFYAIRSISRKGKTETTILHRLILGCRPGQMGDHIDHNTLNNQRYNLRIVTNAQNQQNQKPRKGSSIYKGVSFRKDISKWRAAISPNGRYITIGVYTDEREAALAYDAKARELFGDYALTNF